MKNTVQSLADTIYQLVVCLYKHNNIEVASSHILVLVILRYVNELTPTDKLINGRAPVYIHC